MQRGFDTLPFSPASDRFIRGIIRRKVASLVVQPGFSNEDAEPLEQDLLLRVIQSLRKFDSRVCHRNKFVTAVVERYVRNVVRNRRTGKVSNHQTCSLSLEIQVEGEGPTEIASTLDDRDAGRRLQVYRRSDQSLSQLRHDLEVLIRTLPAHWQQFLELRKKHSITEISARMDVPRSTLNSWIRRIAERFEEAGLREYLD